MTNPNKKDREKIRKNKIIRPNISGASLFVLKEWMDENVILSPTVVGERTQDLYADYMRGFHGKRL